MYYQVLFGRSCSAKAGRHRWAGLSLSIQLCGAFIWATSPNLATVVAGAFARPDEAGNGEYLALVGEFMSFHEIVETLNRQGHKFSFKQVPKEVFAALFPGAGEAAETFTYFRSHTYLGSDSYDRIALAKKNSRPATNHLFGLGSTTCPNLDALNALAPVELCLRPDPVPVPSLPPRSHSARLNSFVASDYLLLGPEPWRSTANFADPVSLARCLLDCFSHCASRGFLGGVNAGP